MNSETVESLADKALRRVDEKTPVSKLISLFGRTRAYEVLVVDGKPGIVTVRDLLKVEHPERTSAKRLARYPPAVGLHTRLNRAAELMIENKIRSLPIAANGKVVGGIRQIDILRQALEDRQLDQYRVEEAMIRGVFTAPEDATAAHVRTMMLRNDISHVPITDSTGRISGLVSARNLVQALVKPRLRVSVLGMRPERIRKWSAKIKGLYDEHPTTAKPRDSLAKVAEILLESGKGAAVVHDSSRVVGIVTPRDILKLLKPIPDHVRVRFLGVKDITFDQESALREKLSRLIQKMVKMEGVMREAVVEVKVGRKEGDRSFYQLKGRIFYQTTGKTFIASAASWSLRKATDMLCERLDKQLRRGRRQPSGARHPQGPSRVRHA